MTYSYFSPRQGKNVRSHEINHHGWQRDDDGKTSSSTVCFLLYFVALDNFWLIHSIHSVLKSPKMSNMNFCTKQFLCFYRKNCKNSHLLKFTFFKIHIFQNPYFTKFKFQKKIEMCYDF